MGTADQDDDTATAADQPKGADGDTTDVADPGGDSDPAAAAGGDATGEEQADENQDRESPS